MLEKQSLQFMNKPYIISSGSIVGSKEAAGPMRVICLRRRLR